MSIGYDESALKRALVEHYGIHPEPHQDRRGRWRIGVNHELYGDELLHYVDLGSGKTRRTLSAEGCAGLLAGDIAEAENRLNALFPGLWRCLDEIRVQALVALAFQLGGDLDKFLLFRLHVEAETWAGAALALRESNWFKAAGSYGRRIVQMIETGVMP